MDNYVARQVHPPSGRDRLAPRPGTHPSKLVSSTGAVLATCVCVQRTASHSLTLHNPLFTRTPQNVRNFLVVDEDGNILQVS